ncbi:OsmC family protein [Spirochaeta africana]|uniref:Putative redox protein, regulator of disulfide bond formation n=1 Tax=Spirochaeta africana (strain ATCC 700263 / DSM 8902 / Z-7692) TaxID=889378 RepID=H9UKP2_SPIAZ|nr:OsmC family protein [Spirochaeta africana]AFG38085.1 putative redox protein, regulator of disulfide bond formation [Spirochaeta africana DSM 8902]
MDVTVEQANDAVHFVARNSEGCEVHIDGSPKVGGTGAGMRPMELVLVSLGTCAAMDLVHILKKQRLDLQKLSFRVHGDRDPAAVPAPFTGFSLHFDLYGDLPAAKVERAVALSVEKYCSVGSMLQLSGPISHSCSIHPPAG